MNSHTTPISVVGAAAVWDYLSPVDELPEVGGIVKVLAASFQPYLGGCAPNIATGLAKLGSTGVRLHYPVGANAQDKSAVESWGKAGVNCLAVQLVENSFSGTAWQYMQPDGATMCFAYAGAAETALPNTAFPLGEWVVVTPVLNQFTLPLLEKALDENKQLISTGICDKRLLPHLHKLRALLVNHHEAEKLCAALHIPTLEALAMHLRDTLIYVTYGKKGARVFCGACLGEVPIIPQPCVRDVTGAGDAFTAGVVFGLIQGLSPVHAGYIGAGCSRFVIEAYGGQSNQAGWPAVKQCLQQYAPEIGNKLAF